MDDFVIKITEPERVRHALDKPVKVYTGRDMQVPFILPVDDGYKEFRVHVKDTPEDLHRHRVEQAKAFDQEPPEHPLNPSFEDDIEERWHVEVEIDGETDEVVVPCEVKGVEWGKWELMNRLKDHLIERYLPEARKQARSLVVKQKRPETSLPGA